MGIPYLSHRGRVDVVRDHVAFFTSLGPSDLAVEAPTCPGWTVGDVLRHVSGGGRTICELAEHSGEPDLDVVGLIATCLNDAAAAPFVDLAPPLEQCVELLETHSEDFSTFLHRGPTTLREQVWHLSGDWGMHRHDVELALGFAPTMTPERAADLVGWLMEYLYPVAEARNEWERPPGLRLVADDAPLDEVAGEGAPQVEVHGPARDLLMMLWRRPIGHVTVQGDPTALNVYLSRAI